MQGCVVLFFFFFFQAEDGIRDVERSRGLGDVYKRQVHGDSEQLKSSLSQTEVDSVITSLCNKSKLSGDVQDFLQKLLRIEVKERSSASDALQHPWICLLYTSDAADDTPCVDLGGRRIIKKKKKKRRYTQKDRNNIEY
eukprot:TRINITY_DN9683_c0_g1_i2.p1 TRINITY_DN9683_c0_g1~~TRINITY_DN9683_c0_g1_i2.p1  ORF type:complete len:139 (+),score=46.91 TRINITY_DN9683_c0_g1_i2:56-472(+)